MHLALSWKGQFQLPQFSFSVGVRGVYAFPSTAIPGKGYQVIRSLEISNFRCFKSLNLSDVRRFNLITGQNASGKTALLEALFVAGGQAPDIYMRTSLWRGREEITIPASPSDMIPFFLEYFFKFDSNNGIRILFTDSNKGDRELRIVASSQTSATLAFGSPPVPETVVLPPHNLKFFFRSPSGSVEGEIEDVKGGLKFPTPKDAYYMVFMNTATIGSAGHNADRFSQLSAANREKPIIKAVHGIFNQVEDLSVLSSGGSAAIHATVRDIDRKIPLGLVSFGINKFVAVLTAIQSAPNGAVLIDEIENGWHHGKLSEMWRAIHDLAEENKTQIFATTHSKEFLELIAPVVSEREKDYSLIQIEKTNSASTAKQFSGREFASAVASGIDVR